MIFVNQEIHDHTFTKVNHLFAEPEKEVSIDIHLHSQKKQPKENPSLESILQIFTSDGMAEITGFFIDFFQSRHIPDKRYRNHNR